MTQDLFRVERGIADDKVSYLSGDGVPVGTSGDTLTSGIGSRYADYTGGNTYRKTANTGAATDWERELDQSDYDALALLVGGGVGDVQDELDFVEEAVGLKADGKFDVTLLAATNYLTSITAVGAVVNSLTTLDSEVKATLDIANAKVAKAGDTMTGNLVLSAGARIRGALAAVNADEPIIKSQLDAAEMNRDFQADVDGQQTDAAFAPAKVAGKRYIVTNTAALHADFGTIAAVGNNDIVEYDGTNFVVKHDVSVAGAGTIVWDRTVGYWKSWDGTNWTEHGGLSGVTAGIGLYKDPGASNTLHIALGAGIVELPTDEVGIDLYPDAGLMLTVDGTTASTNNAAQLIIKRADSSLEVGATGIKVSSTLQTTVSNHTTQIGDINVLLDNARHETEALAVTTQTTVDSVTVDNVESCKWIVTVRGTGANAAKKQVIEVLAIHNGTTSADATASDYTNYAKLTVGAKLVGLTIAVTLSGTGATQNMNLVVASTDEIDVAAIREVLFF